MGLDMYILDANGVEVAYWRKANQIHNWIVNNIQHGTDDCKQYPVMRAQFEPLLALIDKVLASSRLVFGNVSRGERATPQGWQPILEPGFIIDDPTSAIDLLPCTTGFFFGSTDYDERYINQLRYTRQVITDLEPTTKYYYCSSW